MPPKPWSIPIRDDDDIVLAKIWNSGPKSVWFEAMWRVPDIDCAARTKVFGKGPCPHCEHNVGCFPGRSCTRRQRMKVLRIRVSLVIHEIEVGGGAHLGEMSCPQAGGAKVLHENNGWTELAHAFNQCLAMLLRVSTVLDSKLQAKY